MGTRQCLIIVLTLHNPKMPHSKPDEVCHYTLSVSYRVFHVVQSVSDIASQKYVAQNGNHMLYAQF